MQAPIVVAGLCLLLAVAIPSWGGSKNSSPQPSPQQATGAPAPVVLPGGYVRDPTDARKMQQHVKTMRQKAKEAAANRAAAKAKAKQAGPQTATPPQQTEGGTQ